MSAAMPENASHLVGTLTLEQIEHREQFVAFVLTDAEPWHREHLGRLYQSWREWNGLHFEGRLTPPYILLNEPSNPRRYGDCGPISGFGGRSQIRLRPSLLTGTHPDMSRGSDDAQGRFRVVADVLLHEMIHQWHQEVTGETEASYHGHGPAFRDVCNRIGGLLGLDVVRDMKARGKHRDLPSCAHWPHNIRPADYYRGAYVPPSGDAPAEPLASQSEQLGRMFAAALSELPEDQAIDALWDWLIGLDVDLYCHLVNHVALAVEDVGVAA